MDANIDLIIKVLKFERHLIKLNDDEELLLEYRRMLSLNDTKLPILICDIFGMSSATIVGRIYQFRYVLIEKSSAILLDTYDTVFGLYGKVSTNTLDDFRLKQLFVTQQPTTLLTKLIMFRPKLLNGSASVLHLYDTTIMNTYKTLSKDELTNSILDFRYLLYDEVQDKPLLESYDMICNVAFMIGDYDTFEESLQIESSKGKSNIGGFVAGSIVAVIMITFISIIMGVACGVLYFGLTSIDGFINPTDSFLTIMGKLFIGLMLFCIIEEARKKKG